MPCCCVLCFQGKARSERVKRKVSTALVLPGDLGLLGGNNEGLRSDLVFLFSFTNNLDLGPLGVGSFLLLNLLLKFTLTHWNTYERLHNGISSPDELLREISSQFSGDQYQLCLFRWMSDAWWGNCLLLPSFPPFLPPLSDLHGAPPSSLASASHSALFAPLTGCSDTDNIGFEDWLNFCVYGRWLCVFPVLRHRSRPVKSH